MGRLRNGDEQNGKNKPMPIDWLDFNLWPPYDNCGAKYDALTGDGVGCNDNMQNFDGSLFEGEYQETTERDIDDIEPEHSDFDTWQRIQISNPTGVTDFVADWQLWKSRDYLLEFNKQRQDFKPYKKRQMSDLQGKKIDVMFTFYKKTVTNILKDKVFEDGKFCSLDFTANFFYTDHFLLNAETWIDSQ